MGHLHGAESFLRRAFDDFRRPLPLRLHSFINEGLHFVSGDQVASVPFLPDLGVGQDRIADVRRLDPGAYLTRRLSHPLPILAFHWLPLPPGSGLRDFGLIPATRFRCRRPSAL